jgi:beta-lactamase class A
MELSLDKNLGPLQVTEDLETLGLNNTFLGGYFYPGAPLLKRFSTPANSRADINTEPDVYNQTTPTDMGMLLEDIYYCADRAGGTFSAVFPGELTQNECRAMVAYLSKNRNGVLLEAGLPEGTRVAHKHGWILESDGLIHSMSDAGIVYSPGGNYILTIYMHEQQQLLFDSANILVCKLSEATFNFFNLAKQQNRCAN